LNQKKLVGMQDALSDGEGEEDVCFYLNFFAISIEIEI
jgi:hypothetical protein